ncbi:acyl carrier protein [Falsirhodobacter halotolerans]|uniref:acyl carrier protein n=1 Tax=Falsirhodobacter halotolerans TaxID=1146892 RepID=UPI001FD244ED|nr:phosphopantetheine-binding protein [Falsirhodobacter halotolerans]MCJ8139606.1 phosphopantetheine-binding protein [Falsirhodobacter halotolerans]
MAEVEDKVRQIIAEQALLDISDVSRSSTLESLGIDSLMLVEAIFSIEETFDISVPFNANDPGSGQFDISSVGSIIDAIEGLIAQKAS